MEGKRDRFPCAGCGKVFTYWVVAAAPHPKVKCYHCGKEAFPKGEPPAAAAPEALAPASAAP